MYTSSALSIKKDRFGFSLVEATVAVAIITLLLLALIVFQRNYFTLNHIVEGGLNRETGVRKILNSFATEVRAAQQSGAGGYYIETADANTFSFFTNTDTDALIERVRYFLSGTTLKKGILKPTGMPLMYVSVNEKISDVLQDVTGPAAIFAYYNGAYTGTEAALAQPVVVNAIRFIRLTVTVNPMGSNPPGPVTATIASDIRNLRFQ